MSSRLRSLDSKISFFAFADIITAVSGVLIFVALLLATDLGKPTDSRATEDQTETERQIHDTLAKQAQVDAENHRLSALLATAATAPGPGELQTDIARLRKELSQSQKKSAALSEQLEENQAAVNARDKTLGLTALKATIQRTIQETAAVEAQVAQARTEKERLEQQIAHAESQLLKLHQRDGQLWLIPEKSVSSKEPILVTVSGTGINIERFDHPEQSKVFNGANAKSGFEAYLRNSRVEYQYVVFLIRPSGVDIFHVLVKTARNQGFEVGYDALEEDRQIHFSTPPPPDESVPPIAARPDAMRSDQAPTNGPRSGSPAGAGSSPNNAPSSGGYSRQGTGYGNGHDNDTSPDRGNDNASGTGTGTGGDNGTGSDQAAGAATHNGTGTNNDKSTSKSAGKGREANTNSNNQTSGTNAEVKPTSAKPGAATGAPPPTEKSWWQKLLEWLGVK